MRFLLALFLLLASPALAQPSFPPLTGRVVDAAGVIDAETEARLTQALAAHEDATSNQLVVATLPDLQGYEIADYGTRLAREWGIGQRGEDNGAVLIVAPNERAVRIEVGYGLEGVLTDARSRLIIENAILPRFRAGDFSGGVEAGTAAILEVLSGDPEAAERQLRVRQEDDDPGTVATISFLQILVWGLIAWHVMGGFRRGRRGRRRRGGVIFLPGGFGGGRSGGFGGGGGGFGGGFGGGGGSFGGGGATGRW
jgi:uncharacterized protein